MRTLTAATWLGLGAAQTDAVLPILIVIDHDDLANPIRLTNNNADLTYGGNVYTAFPFTIQFPDEKSDSVSKAQITFCNVDRSIIEIIRDLDTAPTVVATACYWKDSGTFDAIMPVTLTLEGITATAETISASLAYEDRLEVEIGAITITPQTFPGSF